MPWMGWPFERVVLLFTGLAFVMIWLQVSLLHWGGAFHKWQMWVPVVYGIVLAIVGIGMAISLTPTTVIAGLILFGIGVLGGLAGLYYHLRAIGYYILGHNIRNYIAGPPPVLPAVFAAMSAFGMLAIYWAAYL